MFLIKPVNITKKTHPVHYERVTSACTWKHEGLISRLSKSVISDQIKVIPPGNPVFRKWSSTEYFHIAIYAF